MSSNPFTFDRFSLARIEHMAEYDFERCDCVLAQHSVDQGQAMIHHHQEHVNNKKGTFTAEDEEPLRKLTADLDTAIRSIGGSAFVRLSARSPKDAIMPPIAAVRNRLRNMERQEGGGNRPNNIMRSLHVEEIHHMKVTSGEEAMTLLLSSHRVLVDLLDATSPQRHSGISDAPKDPWSVQVIVRAFEKINPEMEFRAFCVQGKIMAISQYNHYLYFPHLQSESRRRDILKRIHAFWQEVTSDDSYRCGEMYDAMVVDFLVSDDLQRACIIEINPFGPATGPGLFNWDVDRNILQGGVDLYGDLYQFKDYSGAPETTVDTCHPDVPGCYLRVSSVTRVNEDTICGACPELSSLLDENFDRWCVVSPPVTVYLTFVCYHWSIALPKSSVIYRAGVIASLRYRSQFMFQQTSPLHLIIISVRFYSIHVPRGANVPSSTIKCYLWSSVPSSFALWLRGCNDNPSSPKPFWFIPGNNPAILGDERPKMCTVKDAVICTRDKHLQTSATLNSLPDRTIRTITWLSRLPPYDTSRDHVSSIEYAGCAESLISLRPLKVVEVSTRFPLVFHDAENNSLSCDTHHHTQRHAQPNVIQYNRTSLKERLTRSKSAEGKEERGDGNLNRRSFELPRRHDERRSVDLTRCSLKPPPERSALKTKQPLYHSAEVPNSTKKHVHFADDQEILSNSHGEMKTAHPHAQVTETEAAQQTQAAHQTTQPIYQTQAPVQHAPAYVQPDVQQQQPSHSQNANQSMLPNNSMNLYPSAQKQQQQQQQTQNNVRTVNGRQYLVQGFAPLIVR
ncbi:hypothetical protein PROFUN_14314 [Planoprotostelium fungivorum]|uniref:Cell division cycle protein 123 n=1 Tax=Planoprotostelium fungivorum TaxID=1890364 RepID=A0A2P6N0H4_9EUKA|nr:hypothetical protein PROFUN_14314 [Planoprotostelium fungivorum]